LTMQGRAAAEVLPVLQQQHYFNQCTTFKQLTKDQKVSWIKKGTRCCGCGRGSANSAVLRQGVMSDMQSAASGSAARGERLTREASPRSQSAGDVLPRSCQEGWKRTAENGKGVFVQRR